MSCGLSTCAMQQGGNVLQYVPPNGMSDTPYAAVTKYGGNKRSYKRSYKNKHKRSNRSNKHKRSNKSKSKYNPTKKNKAYLAKWRRGNSIGFSVRSSLKAKGLIPRANGTKRVSEKYDIKSRSKTLSHKKYKIPPLQEYINNKVQVPFTTSPVFRSNTLVGGKF